MEQAEALFVEEHRAFVRGERFVPMRALHRRIAAAATAPDALTAIAYRAWRRAEDDPAVMAWLVRHLGPAPGWRGAGVGVARGIADKHGFQVTGFGEADEPQERRKQGRPMITIPAFEASGPGSEIDVFDLIAIDPDHPAVPHRATGLCDVLAEYPWFPAYASMNETPLGICRDPFAWLRSWGADGPRVAGHPSVVLLDRASAAARDILVSDLTLIADDAVTASALASWIEAARKARRPPRPQIGVAAKSEETDAAA